MPPNIQLNSQDWQAKDAAAFMRSRERHGHLSNMTFGYSITLNGIRFQGPEGLYQALKFPGHPRIQEAIASRNSGMDAKKEAYRHPTILRPDWDEVKLDAMTITLALKLQQNPANFGRALSETGTLHIVECSYRDQWWGAKPLNPTILRGVNALGQLLTILRDLHQQDPGTAAQKMLDLADPAPFRMAGGPLDLNPENNQAGKASR